MGMHLKRTGLRSLLRQLDAINFLPVEGFPNQFSSKSCKKCSSCKLYFDFLSYILIIYIQVISSFPKNIENSVFREMYQSFKY